MIVSYMQKLFTEGQNPDKIDHFVVDDSQTITWAELMLAIDEMGWFIDHEKPLTRRAARWILGHVVRRLKVRVMMDKGLL